MQAVGIRVAGQYPAGWTTQTDVNGWVNHVGDYLGSAWALRLENIHNDADTRNAVIGLLTPLFVTLGPIGIAAEAGVAAVGGTELLRAIVDAVAESALHGSTHLDPINETDRQRLAKLTFVDTVIVLRLANEHRLVSVEGLPADPVWAMKNRSQCRVVVADGHDPMLLDSVLGPAESRYFQESSLHP
jgi:hypothetical protein